MAHPTESIQVIECIEENTTGESAKSGNDATKIVRTIHKFKHGPSLQDIFLCEDAKNLPLLVFSIAGKTKGGKSFLLNLMIKYLEFQSEKQSVSWVRECLHNGFPWKGGIQSITKGLWIWPKIYRLENINKKKVGVLLMDNEGLFDEDMTEKDMASLSGISTVVSYVQMFNVEKQITTDCLKNIVNCLVEGVCDMDSIKNDKLSSKYRLMFVVRDWAGEEEFGFGLDGGQAYIKSHQQKGTKERKQLWGKILETFCEVQCVLLPFPGEAVMTTEFSQSGDLQMLKVAFLVQAQDFISSIFAYHNLLDTHTTGERMYNMLMKVDGKVVDSGLSLLNLHVDYENDMMVGTLMKEFEQKISLNCPSNLQEKQSIIEAVLTEAKQRLKGKSAALNISYLKRKLEEQMNALIVKEIVNQYEEEWSKKKTLTSVYHCQWEIWPKTANEFHHFLGDETVKQESISRCLVKLSKVYYQQLRREIVMNFKTQCDEADSLLQLAGMDERTIKQNYKNNEYPDFEQMQDDYDRPLSLIFSMQEQILRDELFYILLLRVFNLTGVDTQILRRARALQHKYYEALTIISEDIHWHCISKTEKILLQNKVAYAIFGHPSCTSDNMATGYSEEQEGIIKSISDKIISTSLKDPIKLSFVFITFKDDISVPFFIVKNECSFEYVDVKCDVYLKWSDCLNSKSLPPDSVYCYPLEGHYSKIEGFSVGFGQTPKIKTDTTKDLYIKSLLLKVVETISIAFLGYNLTSLFVNSTNGSTAASSMFVSGTSNFWSPFNKLVIIAKPPPPKDVYSKVVNDLVTPHLNNPMIKPIDIFYKSVFFFNCTPQEAISIVRQAFKLSSGASYEEILQSLVSINSVKSVAKTGEHVKIEKYVSETVVGMVKILSATLVPTISKEVFSHLLEIYDHINQNDSRSTYSVQSAMYGLSKKETEALPKLQLKMSKLALSLQAENSKLTNNIKKKEFKNWKYFIKISSQFSTKEGNHLVLILRYLACSIYSVLKMANSLIYESVSPKKCRLNGHAADFYTIENVSFWIQMIITEAEENVDFTFNEDSELLSLVKKVIDFGLEYAKPDWSAKEFGEYLLKIFQNVAEEVCLKAHEHKTLLGQNPTFSDVQRGLEEIRIQGNYGLSLLKDVLQDLKICPHTLTNDEARKLTVVPAWYGILDHLYCYTYDGPVCNKILLIKHLCQSDLEVKITSTYSTESFCILQGLHQNSESVVESVYYIYFETQNNSESGLILARVFQ